MGIVPSSASHKKRPSLPAKPYPDFPLTPHRSGKWCKRIKGHIRYFGRLDDWEGALRQFEHEQPYWYAGKVPPPFGETLTIEELSNSFLEFKEGLVNSGELSRHTFADYRASCQRFCDHLKKRRAVSSLRPDDFQAYRRKLAKTLNHRSLGNEINRVRILLKYAYDNELIDKPIRFGQGFKRPSAKTLRKERAAKRVENGKQMFEAEEIRTLLDHATQPLKAMILLGINCGLGNNDCGLLRPPHVDLESGWLDYERPKTGIERRAKLWPETITALVDALASRPAAKVATARPLFFEPSMASPGQKRRATTQSRRQCESSSPSVSSSTTAQSNTAELTSTAFAIRSKP